MFRTMGRFKQQISDMECVEILKAEKRGALCFDFTIEHMTGKLVKEQ